MKYKNPIISGYHPDPSICRVGEDYYIANSSFEFYPGVPVYHSRNLVNWDLEGYCLTAKEQLDLEKVPSSGGIYAPTLRYHNGEYFMTTTNVSNGGHLIVHTRDMKQGWSAPAWVDQGGIDPTLFFDGNEVYFASTSVDTDGRQGIFMCRINPYTGEKLSESVCISYGCGGTFPEGPHLYKWFGKYYLLLAEGGTEYGHMITLQRADSPYGPYEPCPHNPILSHRDDMQGDICCTGHGDIMEDHNGNWWLVCLGSRSCGEIRRHLKLHNLGRETFLSPVVWNEDGWPVVGNHGRIALEMDGPLPGENISLVCRDFQDDFSREDFSLHYNYIRNPQKENYVRNVNNKELLLKGTAVALSEVDSPTWLGIRQKGFETQSDVTLCPVSPKDGMRVGITAFYNDSYHYEIYLTWKENAWKIQLAKQVHDIFAVTASDTLPGADHQSPEVKLRIVSDREYYYFLYSTDGREYIRLGKGSTAGLSTEGTMYMSFTGTYIGLFAEKGEGRFQDFKVKVMD